MNILVVGDAILDHYLYGDVNRQSPEDSNIPVLDVTYEEYRLGGALNVANNINSLLPNDRVSLLSIYSNYTSRHLEVVDVEPVYSAWYADDERPSNNELIKKRFINNKDQKQLLRADNRLRYKDADLATFEGCVQNINFGNYDCIVVSDYCKGIVSHALIKALEKSLDIPIFVDTKNNNLSVWGTLQPFVKINDHEFSNAIGAYSINDLIVTKGAEGCEYRKTAPFTRGTVVHKYPIYKTVEHPDVVGAGDVFLAGLVAGFMQTQNIEEAIKYANKAACCSVEKQGTSVVSKFDLERF